MSNYDNTNKGVLFPAREKKSEKSPDSTGSCSIKCPACGVVTEWRQSAWKRVAKSGLAFLSQAFSVKEAVPETMGKDDDVPF